MAEPRVFDLEDLASRPGTYFNPQTEVLIVVDDSHALDQELFEQAAIDADGWVLVADEVPIDEDARDHLIDRFQVRYHPGSERSLAAAAGEHDDHDADDELEPDEDEPARDA
jgi:hypothetical protein